MRPGMHGRSRHEAGFLYAGQGSQHPGMGQDLYETYPAFREVLDRAETDFDPKALCFQGPEKQLNQTRYTQPCMVAFAAGLTAVLKEMGIVPDLVAGLSLGSILPWRQLEDWRHRRPFLWPPSGEGYGGSRCRP